MKSNISGGPSEAGSGGRTSSPEAGSSAPASGHPQQTFSLHCYAPCRRDPEARCSGPNNCALVGPLSTFGAGASAKLEVRAQPRAILEHRGCALAIRFVALTKMRHLRRRRGRRPNSTRGDLGEPPDAADTATRQWASRNSITCLMMRPRGAVPSRNRVTHSLRSSTFLACNHYNHRDGGRAKTHFSARK